MTFSGLFTIGIPTTRRPNTGKIYLIQTLDSLLNSTVDKDKVKINIVVLIADDNRTYSHELSKILYTRYQEHVQSGFITIIQTCNCIYPDLNGIKTTFKDSTERLIWRAKQNIDFAFLMLFCRNMSQYYVQIEDDVISSIDFVRDMEAFVDSIPQPWFLLECSRLGFIGKIFKSADLQAMALYLLANYDEMPCDMLLGKFRGLRGQKKPIHSNYSLFQHIGRFSSLKNKLMPSVDRLFKDTFNQSLRVVNVPMGDNPDVNLTTSIEQYSNYTLDNAYDNDDSTFFWGVTPKKSDHFTLRFHSAQNISSIIILSGSPVSRDDTFTNTVLEYREYNDTKYLTGSEGCEGTFIKMAELVEGDLDTDAMGTSIPLNICCLRIRVIKNLKHWVKLREIRVYLLQRR